MDLRKSIDALRRKWPLSAWVFLLLAVACGLGAISAMSGYRSRIEATRPDLGPPIGVVVAAADLPRGSVLGTGDVQIARLPSRVVPTGALADPSAAVGRILLAGIAPGEVVTESRLAPRGAGPIAALVPEGLRAVIVTAPLPPGTVRAGDLVDVLATYGGAHPHTEEAAAAVQVLRVLSASPAGSTDVTAPSGPSLALLVSPSVAQELAYASAFGHLMVAIDGTTTVTGSQGGDPATAATGS
jgi:Flp pilus assembly protein CpaB